MDIQQPEQPRAPWYTSFLLWWFVLTGIYILLLPYTHNLNSNDVTILTYIVAFIGLFVPVGSNNAIFALIGYGLPILAPLAIGIALDLYLKHTSIKPFTKIIINLIVLLIITAVIDVIFLQEWVSFNTFIYGGLDGRHIPHFPF